MKRLTYLDSLRGLAIVFMVINHVGHYLTVQPIVDYYIYLAIYLTVTWAAPLFLFLAGYSLVVVAQRKNETQPELNLNYFLRRGSEIIIAGFLLNILFYFNEEVWYFGRILLAIGIGIITAYPLIKYLKSKWALLLSLVINLILLFCYPLTFGFLTKFVAGQSVVAKVIFGEFSLYPWVLLLFIGVIFGKYFLNLNSDRQLKVVRGLLVGGVLILFGWLTALILIDHFQLLLFDYDFNLNNFWLPSNLTWIWIFGSLMIFFSLMYLLRAKNYFWLEGLQILGANALVIYFLQFFIIKTIGGELLNIRLTGFYASVMAALTIIFILCYLAKSKTFAKLMALNPLKAKAKIS